MIDLQNEEVLSLTEATKRLPRRRRGKRPHIATLYRWVQHGVRGVRLEAIQVGGTLCTSLEALQRFCERCTDASDRPSPSTSKSREREIKKAEAELAEAGI